MSSLSGDDPDADTGTTVTPVQSDEIGNRVARVGAACLGADFSQLPCTDHEEAATIPDGDTFQAGRLALTWGVEALPMIPNVRLITMLRGDDHLASRFRTEIQPLLKRLAQKIKDDGLDACHKACLVQCLTSQLLTYDDAQFASFLTAATKPQDLGPDYAGGAGAGVCRNYANLAEELGKALGMTLDPITVRSANHVMVQYQDGGTNYLVEPQRNPLQSHDCLREPQPAPGSPQGAH
ncbi:MAG TPA: hypothetical protein VL588_11655 [Bdellovibrionota bacterium]|nr:hypothetical protein [Bdellovibrionota bacterium]